MAVYFSRQLAKRSPVRQLGLTPGALRQLESYNFPNNIQARPGLSSPAFIHHDLWTAGPSLHDNPLLCVCVESWTFSQRMPALCT